MIESSKGYIAVVNNGLVLVLVLALLLLSLVVVTSDGDSWQNF